MGLSDFAGIFSRSFVIGYYVPSFFTLFLLSLIVDERARPHAFQQASGGTQVLVLGGVSLLFGLLLSGLNRPLMRLLEGYPLRNGRGRVRRWLDRKLSGRWRARFAKLTNQLRQSRSDERTAAAKSLQLQFPPSERLVLPTAFGNAIRSFETHPRRRYNLDGITLWPRIELLLSDGAREAVSDAQTNVLFFVNAIALLTVAATLVVIDRIWHASCVRQGLWQSVGAAVAALLLASGAYKGAVSAVVDWGASVRAAFDLYRLDVYAKLGVRVPTSPEDELAIGRAVSRCLLFGEPIAAELRAPPPPPAEAPAR